MSKTNRETDILVRPDFSRMSEDQKIRIKDAIGINIGRTLSMQKVEIIYSICAETYRRVVKNRKDYISSKRLKKNRLVDNVV